MALNRNAYKALESVVGPKNISEDPAVLLGYGYSGLLTMGDTNEKFTPNPPVAVVLPGTTEEVQGIVKVCNRNSVKYRGSSTGYGYGMPGVAGVVAVDLRRMDRLVDIDEKNMFAVIEPYVTAGQIQVEAMKRGLNTHVVSCGSQHSPLASATSLNGWSNMGLTTSQNARNMFGVEWVTPTGEVVRMGSPGCGAGWFSGDGPGPSLRGIIRGYCGAAGGLGIFTRIGYKLYPWPGPAEIKRTGEHPQIGWEVPENFKYCFPYWESWEDAIEATYRITEARVAYMLNRLPPDQASWALARSNNEFYELFQKNALLFKREHQKGFNVIIAARRESEFKYKMKALEKIVQETRGKFLSLTPEQESFFLLFNFTMNYTVRGARLTGVFGTTFGHFESIGLMKKVVQAGEKFLAEDSMKKHLLALNDTEGFWGWPTEGKHWWQEGTYIMRKDRDSMKASVQHWMQVFDATAEAKGGLGMMPFILMGEQLVELYGPILGNVQEWMRKIKNTFDPQNSSDHTDYVSPEPLKMPH